MILFELIMIF